MNDPGFGDPPAHLLTRHPEHADQWDPVVQGWLVRTFDTGAVVHVAPLMFTAAILVSPRLGSLGYTDRWCYETTSAALRAAERWTGPYPATEPHGWHRHPATGRRRAGGDPATEVIAR